jgi:predicted aldo/keto reductase-like oxidoreductase
MGVREFLDAAKADGRIRFAGFSFHDDQPAFAPIVDAYSWDFCQIQYNYMDVNTQAGAAGLGYAAGKGLGVIVMEPVKGGRLATPPPIIQALWETAPAKRSAAEWALRFVWNDERVSMVLSGMSTMEQVVENVRVAAEAEAGSLARSELDLIELVRDAYLARTVVDCTACRYCLPCPQGIDIPGAFSSVNDAALFDDPGMARIGYQIAVEQGFTKPVSACEECGQCEERCPQQLNIIEQLAKAAELLG